MFYALNNKTRAFTAWQFPEEVTKFLAAELARGVNEDEIVVLHCLDEDLMSVNEYFQKWS